jgi:hypothetical protein
MSYCTCITMDQKKSLLLLSSVMSTDGISERSAHWATLTGAGETQHWWRCAGLGSHCQEWQQQRIQRMPQDEEVRGAVRHAAQVPEHPLPSMQARKSRSVTASDCDSAYARRSEPHARELEHCASGS